uniref:Uncharacterized protein n=1 Tax=Rhodnius prolixus TaxID=13249 RepID=T1HFF4_RHOPR
MIDEELGRALELSPCQRKAGRRLIQYSVKSAWYILQQQKLSSAKYVDILKSLECNMANFRKVLRFGRFTDHLYLALFGKVSSVKPIAVASTTSKLAFAAFLLCDHILWIARVGLIDTDTDRWSKSANRYWAISVCVQLLIDTYEIYRIVNSSKISDRRSDIYLLLFHHRKDLALDTLKNLLDLIIPLSGTNMAVSHVKKELVFVF